MGMSQDRILQRTTKVEGHHYTSYLTQTTQAFQAEIQSYPTEVTQQTGCPQQNFKLLKTSNNSVYFLLHTWLEPQSPGWKSCPCLKSFISPKCRLPRSLNFFHACYVHKGISQLPPHSTYQWWERADNMIPIWHHFSGVHTDDMFPFQRLAVFQYTSQRY